MNLFFNIIHYWHYYRGIQQITIEYKQSIRKAVVEANVCRLA